jgi:serine/threonine protein phosphatase PrpC
VGVQQTHTLESDDVIVVYSDGISDNMLPRQFHDCFLSLSSSSSYSWIADCIARTAYFLGKDKTFDSPFAQGARDAGWGVNYGGGKHDDITVVVAQVQQGNVPIPVEDPYYQESIFIYTGPVPPKEDMVDPASFKKLVHEEL